MQRRTDSNVTIRRKEGNNHQIHYIFGKTTLLTIRGRVVIDVYLIKGLYSWATMKNKANQSKVNIRLQATVI